MVWLVSAEPPSLPLVQESDADLLPAVAFTAVGAAGAVAAKGVMVLDLADAGLLPMLLVAVTVKAYAFPAVRPVIRAVVADAATVTLLITWVPEWTVMVCPVRAEPPSLPLTQVSAAADTSAVALTVVGAVGALATGAGAGAGAGEPA